jgi:hypothetical protein
MQLTLLQDLLYVTLERDVDVETLGDGFEFLSGSHSFCYNSVPSVGSPSCYV